MEYQLTNCQLRTGKIGKMVYIRLNRDETMFKGMNVDRLKEFQRQQLFTDVILLCEDKLYHAHKLVITSASSHARMKILFPNLNYSTILMTGVSPQDVENLICFLYAGEVWIPPGELQGFLRAAKILRIDRLEPNPEIDLPIEMIYKSNEAPAESSGSLRPLQNINQVNIPLSTINRQGQVHVRQSRNNLVSQLDQENLPGPSTNLINGRFTLGQIQNSKIKNNRQKIKKRGRQPEKFRDEPMDCDVDSFIDHQQLKDGPLIFDDALDHRADLNDSWQFNLNCNLDNKIDLNDSNYFERSRSPRVTFLPTVERSLSFSMKRPKTSTPFHDVIPCQLFPSPETVPSVHILTAPLTPSDPVNDVDMAETKEESSHVVQSPKQQIQPIKLRKCFVSVHDCQKNLPIGQDGQELKVNFQNNLSNDNQGEGRNETISMVEQSPETLARITKRKVLRTRRERERKSKIFTRTQARLEKKATKLKLKIGGQKTLVNGDDGGKEGQKFKSQRKEMLTKEKREKLRRKCKRDTLWLQRQKS